MLDKKASLVGAMMLFLNRFEAGRKLANALAEYAGQEVVVYALPRGGVVIGVEVARSLNAKLDLIVVRKIGHPRCAEYAIAAVAEDGHMVANEQEIRSVDEAWFNENVRIQRAEAARRRAAFVGNRAVVSSKDKVAIIVDDGLATGLTMAAAIQEVRHFLPSRVVVAVPVAPPKPVDEVRHMVDAVVVLFVTENFAAIGAFYDEFDQVTDGEVVELMKGVNHGDGIA